MITSVYNYPVSQLFDIDASVVYVIPKYQREYIWKRHQWENLFDDVTENNPGYFLGSLICINQVTDALSVQELEVVDGQQRLTTLSLLFAAGYQALKERYKDLSDDQRLELMNLKRKLVLKKGKDKIRVVPQVQNNNLDDYRAVLSDIEVIGEVNIPSYAGNRRIFHAYKYFKERIYEMMDGQGDEVTTIMDFLDKVSQATLVKIEVASHADAYTLFESLNNRGMPLTAIDLIKNKLLSRLESMEPGSIDYYFENWNRLLNYLGDDYTIQERFFRQYYDAFKDELNTLFRKEGDKTQDPLGYMATRSNLISIYQKIIDKDAKWFLKNINSASRKYAILLFRNQDDAIDCLEKALKDLERIQGAPSHLLMLYLLVRRDDLQTRDEHLAQILHLLVRFFVRRNLTDTPPTRDLTRLFMGIIDKLDGKKGVEVVDVIREQLIAKSASDEMFRHKLEGPIYEENSWVARFILCALAEEGMTIETRVDLWGFKNKQYVWTIEHIFPQGEHIPKSWVDMMADGDEQRSKDYQQSHVHKLGNLTISGFNSALGNKSFEEKRDRTDRKTGLHVGYKNGLKLNEDLADADIWSVALIDARTSKLVDKATGLFQLNGDD